VITLNLLELQNQISNKYVLLFGYTKNCGTCYLAEKMLDLVGETVKELQIIKVNLSLSNEIISEYKLKSTPSFTLLKDSIVVDQFYAFHSVTFLYEKINNLIEK